MEHSIFKQSAVLILLIPTNTGFNLVLTTRSHNIKSHKGQMSFPGGKFDADQDKCLCDTALRETQEEIGVESNLIKIIGRLDDLPTTSGYNISPFIGVFTGNLPIIYSINSDEVADLVEISVDFFLNEKIFSDKIDFEFTFRNFKATSIYVDYYDKITSKKYHIWGATAHIIADFFKICYNHLLTKPEYSRPPLSLVIEYLKEKKDGKHKNGKKKGFKDK